MLSNGHHRSLLQTSKITEMLKQPTLGTLSPETTATTSSGYSTGGSSVSTSINPSLKKSSVSSSSTGGKQLLQQQQQQQQHKTKSKGKKNIIHVAKGPIYALAISIVLLQMTFTMYFSSIHHVSIYHSILQQNRKKSPIYNYCTNLPAFALGRNSLPNFVFFFIHCKHRYIFLYTSYYDGI